MSGLKYDPIGQTNFTIWLFPAFISSFVSVCLLILSFFPLVRGYSIFENQSIAFLPFMLRQSISNMALTFIICTSIVYWCTGIYLLRMSLLVKQGWRKFLSSYICSLAIGSLCFVLPMLVTLWVLAFDSENIPADSWGVTDGNHGSWRYAYDLRKMLSHIYLIPVISVFLSFVSWVIKPTWRSVEVIIASVAMFIILLVSHNWLID